MSYRGRRLRSVSLGSRCRWWRSEISSRLCVLRECSRSPGNSSNSSCGPESGTWWTRPRRAAAGPRRTVGTVTPTRWRRSEDRQRTPPSRKSSVPPATEPYGLAPLQTGSGLRWRILRRDSERSTRRWRPDMWSRSEACNWSHAPADWALGRWH